MKNAIDTPIVYSVVTHDYLPLVGPWSHRVSNASGLRPSFVCAETETAAAIVALGFECSVVSLPPDHSRKNLTQYPRSTFTSDLAAWVVRLKLTKALEILRGGQSCLYSDLDALWLRNPLSLLNELDCDFAFQAGSFPKEAKDRYGFAICSGFMHFRPTQKAMTFLEKSLMRFEGSDQACINKSLLQDYAVDWSSAPPLKWEVPKTNAGWVDPILGQCSRSDIKLAALPHAHFQRHNVSRENLGHAILCHPNSPKVCEDKIEVFRRLGLWPELEPTN